MSSYSSPAALHDARGLTGTGAVATALGLGLVGGLIDVAHTPALGGFFAVLFTVGCVLAAWRVHREDLVTAVVMPPLVYVAVALLTVPFLPSSRAGSELVKFAFGVLNAVVLGAPVLLVATALTAAVAGYRRFSQPTA